MGNLDIGLTGLTAAQSSLELIGTNVANASTAGYHRQDGILTAIAPASQGNSVSGGVQFAGAQRAISQLVDQQLLQQTSAGSEASQSLTALQSLQSAFGQTGSEPLRVDLDAFMNAFSELSSSPSDNALQQQVVTSASTLCGDFHQLSQYIGTTVSNLQQQVSDLTTQANQLIPQIAALNQQVEQASNSSAANVLKDQRDEAITNLANIIGVQSPEGTDETTQRNVSVGDTPVVTGDTCTTLVAGNCSNGQMGLAAAGSNDFSSNYSGGQLGAVLQLVNQTLPNLSTQLNSLANQIASSVNQIHVQGVGQNGSFTDLTGSQVGDGTIDSWNQGVTAGSFYVRVTDQATGAVTRSAVTIDPSTDTLATVAQKISDVPNLSASVIDGQLSVQASDGYAFDFLPALSATPANSSISGTSVPTISGDYTGTSNTNYTVTVVGSGQVGVAQNLNLDVYDANDNLISTLNVGQGYASGDTLDAGNGIAIAMSAGTLSGGDNFQIQALASSDTTGFLAAAGLNTFFQGASADSIDVRQDLVNNPGNLAVSTSQSMTDTDNLTRLAALANQSNPALGGLTLGGYVDQTITGLGTQVSSTQAKQTMLDQVVTQLTNQQDSVSGVDLNDESAKLLEFQQMYQAMAKYIDVQDQSTQYLISLVQ